MVNPANLYAPSSEEEVRRQALTGEPMSANPQSRSDPLVTRYFREIERYKQTASSWHEDGENIERIYMDETGSHSSARRFPLLWSNVETLKPAVYTKTPSVVCSRRYKDRDPVARTAAELMERATNTSFELYGVDEVFRMVRDDRLLPGRGTAWVRYEPTIQTVEDVTMEWDEEAQAEVERVIAYDKLVSEKVCVDYVHWQDFGHNVARVWADVWLVWRCVYLTREEAEERFGSEAAGRLSYTAKAPVGDYDGARGYEGSDNYCKIYELWDKVRGLVSWLAEGQREFIESGEPPINVHGFFPCPEPCYATKSSKSLIPKPDYAYYRDQAKEINDLTDKIGAMTQWLIVKGFIPGGPSTIADPIQEMVQEKSNRELFVQVESMTEFTEMGGSSKLVDWFPVEKVIIALKAAIEARAQLIQDTFQINGIADILRGQSDPDETYGAVELRSQTGSRRLRNTKDDIARFCKDIARMTAEVIAENFSPKSIAEITGYRYQPPVMGVPNMTNVAMFPGAQMPPMGMGHNGGPGLEAGDEDNLVFDDRVIELLRDDKLRSFRVDIETDSTVQADESAERRDTNEYISSMVSALKTAAEVVAQAPDFSKTIGDLMMLGARRHRVGRSMEETIERNFASMVKRAEAQRNAPQPEDPVITVAKTQVAGEIEKNRTNAQLKAKEIQTDAALEMRKQDIDAVVEIRDQNLDAAIKARGMAPAVGNRDQANEILSALANAISQGLSQPRLAS